MSIRAVIFDFGGVIVRTEDRTSRAQLAERLGLTYDQLSAIVFDSKSAHLATIGEITTAEHWENVRETLGLSAGEFPQVPDDFWGGDRVDQILVNFLRELRGEYKTALLSNAWDDLRGMICEVWKIDDAFDEILISAEIGLVKPDPRIYQRLLADLQVAPAEAVFVDDFQHNVEGAREVGLQGIQFKNRQQALQELQELLDGK
jgi:putative hydrolase of the HAD superfamily